MLQSNKKHLFAQVPFVGSEGGDRTHDQEITSFPQVSMRDGLYHHRQCGVGRFGLVAYSLAG
jgi:hypothetical protein